MPGDDHDPGAARAAKTRKALDSANDTGPRVLALRQSGLSLRAINHRLDGEAIRTTRDGAWTAVAVAAVLARTV